MLHILRQRRVRATWLPLLLAAVFARALLPVGFMPTLHDGRPALEICGPAALILAGDGAQGAGSDHARDTCPFTVAAAPAPPPAPFATFLAALTDAAVAPLPAAALPAAPAPRAHPPRGPPSPT